MGKKLLFLFMVFLLMFPLAFCQPSGSPPSSERFNITDTIKVTVVRRNRGIPFRLILLAVLVVVTVVVAVSAYIYAKYLKK